MVQPTQTIRHHLLSEARRFVERACTVQGVRRIALIGSLTNKKREPKDADVLVWIDDQADLPALARAARPLPAVASASSAR